MNTALGSGRRRRGLGNSLSMMKKVSSNSKAIFQRVLWTKDATTGVIILGGMTVDNA